MHFTLSAELGAQLSDMVGSWLDNQIDPPLTFRAPRHADVPRAKNLISPALSTPSPLSRSRAKNIPLCVSPKSAALLRASRLMKRGVSRSSRTWRRGAVAATARRRFTPTNELIRLRGNRDGTGTRPVALVLAQGFRGRPSRVVLAPRRWR
jgi:hypothetical protein